MNTNVYIKKFFNYSLFLSIISILGITFAPLHTKILGLGWISILLLSLCIILGNTKTSSIQRFPELFKSAKIWLYIVFTAYFMRLSVQVYHGEFNESSNFNLRMLVFALLVYYVLPKINLIFIKKYYLGYLQISLLGIGFSAFVITSPLHGILNFGTNQIPWAAGITFLGIVIYLVMNHNRFNNSYQIFGWLSILFIIFSILSFGVRGSYFFIFWFPVLILIKLFLFKKSSDKITFDFTIKLVIPLLIVSIPLLLYYIFPQKISQGIDRIANAYIEVTQFIDSPVLGANSSVGARLYMWINAIRHVNEYPLAGFGISGTKELIKIFADESGSVIIRDLNQLHNEYLQALLSYGIIGLISFLLYPIGLVLIGIKIRSSHPYASIAFIGLAFLFLTSSLTNTNTYHNFFANSLSLSVWLIFILTAVDDTLKNTTKNSQIK